jgi:deoxyribonuclease-4
MIRIGIAGIPHSAKGKGTEAGIERLHALGLDAMELQFGRNVYMTVEAAAASAVVAEKEDVSLSVHAPYYVNLTSKSEATREKSKDWIVKSARVASALGASVVTVHAAREVLPDVVVASFRDLVKALKKERITVPLGLETMGDEGEFGSLDEVLEVVRKVPGTTVVIDVAHIYARTDGGLKTLADFEEIFDRVDRVKKGGYHIHFSGIEHKNSREVRHLPLGEGGPDVALFARALTQRKRDATVICESPLLEEDALKLQKAFASASASDKYK